MGLAVVPGSFAALDAVIAGVDGPGPVRRFLLDDARRDVRWALARCLPDASGAALELIRTKIKPGRKLTAWYDVRLPGAAPRRVAATWVAAGAALPAAAPGLEEEALHRGLIAPFQRLSAAPAGARMCLQVCPLDPAFPQLVRLHDPAHVSGLLATRDSGSTAWIAPSVRTVRYRPGQRHVLSFSAGPGGPGLFAKVYRDDTGLAAVGRARRAGAALAAAGGAVRAVEPVGYDPADRVSLWPEVSGQPLSCRVGAGGREAELLVGRAAAALRAMHDWPDSPRDGLVDHDVLAEAAATARAAEHVGVLVPAVGDRLRGIVTTVVGGVLALPQEPPRTTHGDYKCDNLLVGSDGLHVIDFDRGARADPALDLAKFLADLCWWADAAGVRPDRLREACLTGYGPCDPARLARTHVLEALFRLKLAARRVPVQDRRWTRRLGDCVDQVEALLSEVVAR